MPLLQNSTGEPLTKERKQGLVISAVIHIILALLIIFVTIRIEIPEPVEEGLLVNFGFDETGSGLFEPAPEPASTPPPPAASADESSDEALLTQEFEEAVEVEKKEPSPEELRKQAEARAAEIKRQMEAEARAEAERKRLEEEAAERRRQEEEQRRIDQTNARARNAFSNKANTGPGQSEGVAGGQGNQGKETGTTGVPNYDQGGGRGNEGVSYDLGDRKAQSLFRPPYDIQRDGIVVVAVTVDRSGRVTDATPGIKGSTTLDEGLLRIAKEAALKTRFESRNDAPIIQKGTITYDFRFK